MSSKIQANWNPLDSMNTVSVTLEIYSELEPLELSPEMSRCQAEDVTAFLKGIEGFSRAYGADFDLYLDSEQISGIENGELDEEGLEGWLEVALSSVTLLKG